MFFRHIIISHLRKGISQLTFIRVNRMRKIRWIFLLQIVAMPLLMGIGNSSSQGNVENVDSELAEEIKWLQSEAIVFTASKQEQKIFQAPSVMTVYTAEDIKRQGLRTVNEVLDRTVGFFTTRNVANPLIANRGIVAGENEPYLLLLDGHNMNSIVDKGPGDYSIFPLISHVKRIEIVRGPGSTLWGSDAALGVIHIITKNGSDIDGMQVSVDYATEDNFRYGNVLYGNGDGVDRDIMFSFTYAQSDGFPREGYVPDPGWGTTPWGPAEKIKDSWELYGKIKHKDFTVTARGADLMDSRLIDSQFQVSGGDPDRVKYNRRRHYFVNIGHQKEFRNNLSLETKVFTNLMERWQQLANPITSSDLALVDESFSSKENNLGIEMTLRARLMETHALLAGIQVVQTEIDPVNQFVLYPLPGNTTDTAQYHVLVAPDEPDRNMAVYLEDNWSVIEDLNLILGVRVDHNTLREESTKVLPRFAAIWGFSPHWTTKYTFNTGYVRPPVGKSFLGQTPSLPRNTFFGPLTSTYLGAEESEEVYSHDLQLAYHRPEIQASITGYYVRFENAFNLYGVDFFDANLQLYTPLYVNSNTITSYGLECDFRHNLNRSISWYGNYSWVIFSEMDRFTGAGSGFTYNWQDTYLVTDGKALTQFPHHIWNLGVDFLAQDLGPARETTLNLHYRGWTDMSAEIASAAGNYQRLGPEHFIDANLLFAAFLVDNLDVSVYVKNLLDNTEPSNSLPLAGRWPSRGRSLGGKVVFKF
jgi:outer membrane receptor for ferrienterochelin and colicin